MKTRCRINIVRALSSALWFMIPYVTWADNMSDLQKQLNAQVMQKPFSVENEANLNAYIEEATKRGTPPKSQPSKYWRQGYTCADLRRYSWADYRDCSYYYHYHGYYWPY